MQVKIFEAENMAATLKKVKETLGPDALILSTKTVRKGGLGILGKPSVEITAAVDTPVDSGWLARSNTASAQPVQPAPRRSARPVEIATVGTAEEELTYDKIWREQIPLEEKHENHHSRPQEQEQDILEKPEAAGLTTIRSELDEIKHLLQDISSRPVVTSLRQPLPVDPQKDEWQDSRITKMQRKLKKCGIGSEATELIIGDILRQNLSVEDKESNTTLAESMAEHIRVNGPIETETGTQKRIALIGPTGVGKTTTIAKLAAAHLAANGRKVALITIDTYRIAAVEQLKVYGEIMRLPVEVVITPEQLPEVLAKHEDKELILIDTAGRSPRDDIRIQELASYLTADLDIECHLVLAANTREEDLADTVRRFGRLSLNSIVFTKIDECSGFGSLFNIPHENGYPLSYLTNGQRVPEDLLLAEPTEVSRLIIDQEYKDYHDGDIA